MDALLNPAQTDVLATLRGNRDDRPKVDPELRKALQAELEAGLRDIEGPLTIDKYSLSKVHQCEGKYLAVDEFKWSPANARGTIAHKAIELSADGEAPITPAKLVQLAINRISENPDSQSLADYLRQAGDGERAELRVAATDLVIKFGEMFPPFESRWAPNAEATTAAYVGNRRIVFRGKIDIKLGVLQADKASTLILDLKTGNPSFTDLEDLRFYALLETLRTGVPPFKWANVYISAGRTEAEEFSDGALWAANRRLVDGVRKIAELKDGRSPKLTPGNACGFCPARPSCAAAGKWTQQKRQYDSHSST